MFSAEIEITSGPLRGKRIQLAEGPTTVGRQSTCTIAVPEYDEVSRHHTTLHLSTTGLRIEDNQSKNGVKVQGQKVGIADLRHGDVVRLGDCEFVVNLQKLAEPVRPPVRGQDRAATPPSSTKVLIGLALVIAAGIGYVAWTQTRPGPAKKAGTPVVENGSVATTPKTPEEVAKSVVMVVSLNASQSSGGVGTGFCVNRPDLILTNAHVALEGSDRDAFGRVTDPVIRVFLDPGQDSERLTTGEIIRVDTNRDLALIKLQRGALTPLEIGDTAAVRNLDEVTAIGFPRGLELTARSGAPEPSFSKMSVQSVKRDNDGEPAFLQVGGNIAHGNSGGPVVNAAGAVVGVATQKVEEINLCIPSNRIKRFIERSVAQLIASEEDERKEVGDRSP